jgi:type IV secretion system protein VirB4
MREYPAVTWPGMMDAILAAPYHCVLTQSFGFMSKQVAQNIMTRKQNQMVAARDKAASQTEALTEAADLLASNAFVMGDHHLSLTTFGTSLDKLRQVAARARRDLAESGAVVVREDMALEAAYWAQLPGNMKLRSRPGAVNSSNFAAMSAFHNYPPGAERGHWGKPLTVFRTTGGTAYRFHIHAPTETVKDLGNIFIAGPSGSGKTTLMLFLLAMAERQGATTVLFDKDRGGELWVRASGGAYLVLPSGERSGLAPLKALDASPANVEFIKDLVTALVMEPGKDMLPEDERRLEMGVTAVLGLPAEQRSFSELRAFLGQSDAEGPGARLQKWCKGGSLGWVLDNDEDCISLDAQCIGFDTTVVLDDPVTRGPILSYLFHRVRSLFDGRRLILAIDEFWKALADPGFRDIINDQLKTIRKLNGCSWVATQSPADALRSPIAHSIIEQCPTQILMGNTRADARDYRDGLKLTRGEHLAIREELTIGRRFLLKQGRGGVACEFDLAGMDDNVAILSTRASTVRLSERLRAEFGDAPEAWLPPFRQRWRSVAS